MLTINGMSKMVGESVGGGCHIIGIQQTPKDYIIKILREIRVYNPITFQPQIKETEFFLTIGREEDKIGGMRAWWIRSQWGHKFPVSQGTLRDRIEFINTLSNGVNEVLNHI